MQHDIFLFFPDDDDAQPIRGDFEWELEELFGDAAINTCGEGGKDGLLLAYELQDGQDVGAWVARLRELLGRTRAGPGTFFEVFPDDWGPGLPYRRVEVFGADGMLTDRPRRSMI